MTCEAGPEIRGRVSRGWWWSGTEAVFWAALRIKERYQLSYWDSAILAAALELGCHTVYFQLVILRYSAPASVAARRKFSSV
jgi:hypothetical protein